MAKQKHLKHIGRKGIQVTSFNLTQSEEGLMVENINVTVGNRVLPFNMNNFSPKANQRLMQRVTRIIEREVFESIYRKGL